MIRREEDSVSLLGSGIGKEALRRENFTFNTAYTSVLVVLLTSWWYFTSSKNAIATQQLVETDELKGQIQNNDASKAYAMALLTSLQILVNVPLFLAFSSFRYKSQLRSLPYSNLHVDSLWRLNARKIAIAGLVGVLHYFGSFFTNMGFMYGSATLVQVVKLLEPVETLIFMALVNMFIFRTDHGITSRKAAGTFFVVGGALVLLLQKGIKTRENPVSVVFALLSGLTLATRNVTQKSSKSAEAEKEPKLNNENKSKWQDKLLKGLENFFTINTIAAIPSMIALVIIPENRKMVSLIWNAAGGCGMQAVFFHGMYNMASISVLSMVAVQTHSLLNVGKRITNVIVATMFFGINLQISGIIGLLVALFGGFVYAGAFKDMEAILYRRVQEE